MARFMSFACLFLLCFAVQQQQASGNPIMIAKAAINFALGVYKDVKMIQEFLAAPPSEDSQISLGETKVLNKLDDLAGDIQNLKDDLMNKISKDLQTKVGVKTDVLFSYVRDVDRVYKRFLSYVKNANQLQRSTLDNFSEMVTTSSLYELSSTIEKMHETLTNSDIGRESILSLLADNSNPELMCLRNQSPQQVINELYKLVIFSDMKGLAVKLFAYEQKEQHDKVEYKFEKEQLMEEFKQRSKDTYKKVLQTMSSASREIWRCDPAHHTKDVTYTKLQEVFTTIINFERDMRSTCTWVCEDFDNVESDCDSSFCKNEPKKCNGRLRNCELLDNKKTFCRAPVSSDRRYEWMTTSNGKHYGHVTETCKDKVTTDYENAAWFYHCDYCACTCDSHNNQLDRYFSLIAATSDTLRNKVITGVRLVKHNHIFYIQIQQGQLGANGTIDPATVEWKPIDAVTDKYDYTKGLFEKNQFVYGVNWDKKTVYLDDIEDKSSENQVLTGLRFKQVGNDLRLEAEMTQFEYETGRMVGRSNWLYNEDRKESRTAVSLSKADDPLRLTHHIKDSQNGQFVEFQMTDLEKDFGQLTVPFIDIQEVVSDPPVPIAGAGIFHKGRDGSGGFLALKLIQFDFTNHL